MWSYFFSCRTHQGLVLDRESNKNLVSIAATGFGMAVWALAVDKRLISYSQAILYINQAIDSVIDNNPVDNRGWLHHFLTAEGVPNGSEVSTIDTAIFYLGARLASKILDNSNLSQRVENLIAKVDQDYMLHNCYFRHGKREKLLEIVWDCYSEGVVIYKLFDRPYNPPCLQYDLPLFVYYYPLCFFQDDKMIDILRKAIQYQNETHGYWGITACDGPDGYQINNPYIVSPLQVQAICQFLNLEYPFAVKDACGYDLRTGWLSTDLVGIDLGSCLILQSKTII